MIYFVSGGADSGKSFFSESIMTSFKGRKLYIAAMENSSTHAKKRIAYHRKMREGKGFETYEKQKDYKCINVEDYEAVILECLGTLTANHLYGGGNIESLFQDIDYLLENCKNLVIVSNDISSCGITYNKEMVEYMKTLNKASIYIAEKSDVVVESISGIPYIHKGAL